MASKMTASSAQHTSHVDVLIVGAGPAGLMLALWMARLGIKTRVVDKRTGKVFSGQADGFQVRTLEILDSFGIGDSVWKEANHMIEVTFWSPDDKGIIRRDVRMPDTTPGLSRFTQCVLHQGRMETFLLDAIRASESAPADPQVRIERQTMPTALRMDEGLADDEDAYPIEVTLRHLSEEEATPAQRLSNLGGGMHRSNLADDDTSNILERSAAGTEQQRGKEEEQVRARFLVGCDGAHSWVRKTLGEGFEMVGELTDAIWGVLDVVPITDFPDIRNRCMVHSAEAGTIMVIPREGRLVRLYIQLGATASCGGSDGGRVDRHQITPAAILEAAQKILSPYTIGYHYIDWWTAYRIGQRCGKRFNKLDRIFLAGDAVHTHSPKAGQGMNTSMQDTYNLGWKLGLVCNKMARRGVLSTYELERRQVAEQLIAFDQEFASMFTGRPARGERDGAGVSMKGFQEAFRMSQMFTTGVGIHYKPNVLVSTTDDDEQCGTVIVSDQELATNCKPGTRFASYKVLNQADPRPWELHHLMSSDGRFRVVVFGGDVSRPAQRALVNGLGEWLATVLLPRYPCLTLTLGPGQRTKNAERAGIIDVLLVHAARREDVELLTDLHDVYHPFDAKLGWNYDKTFVDGPSYHEGHGRAYEGYGVEADGGGAAVVVRPDGYVGLVASLDDRGRDRMGAWFDAVLRRRGVETDCAREGHREEKGRGAEGETVGLG